MNRHEHLFDLLTSFETAFLVTNGTQGPHARPLSVASIEGTTILWFLTSVGSEKAQEIEFDPQVLVTFQGKGKFVVLRGTATTTQDRAKLDELFREPHRIWFPKGAHDPSLAAVKVKVDHAEYWDQTGTKGLRFVVDALAAYVTGDVVDAPSGSHGELHPAAGRPPT
jgi:general stress protein 26